jgi:hypothetical protein
MAVAQRNYIDFKLYLTSTAKGKGACQVALLPTPEVGETITPITVPIEECPDSGSLQLLAAKQGTFGSMVALGKKLANCLLPEGVIRERFHAAYDRSGTEGGVRLRLIIADHALKTWPWEYAFLDFLGGSESKSMLGFLALNPRISLVRHEPLPYPHPVREKTTEDVTDIRMAFASALPKKQPKLQLDKDLAVIRNALKDFNVEGVRCTLDPVLTDTTPDDLAQKLPKGTHIFHFAGHGVPESETSAAGPHHESALLLVADKKTKKEARLHASELAWTLKDAGVRLVVLGACYSGERQERYPWDGVAGALAASEIPAIVAMQYEVVDVSAEAFSRAFYFALASGLSLDEAMSTGRRAMLRETSTNPDLKYVVDYEWGVPVLYSRLPDGQLFPERMQRAGATAVQFRTVISQQVTDSLNGKLTGVKVSLIKGSVFVEQDLGVVGKGGMGIGGSVTKIEPGANVMIKQTATRVENEGEINGLIVDEL